VAEQWVPVVLSAGARCPVVGGPWLPPWWCAAAPVLAAPVLDGVHPRAQRDRRRAAVGSGGAGGAGTACGVLGGRKFPVRPTFAAPPPMSAKTAGLALTPRLGEHRWGKSGARDLPERRGIAVRDERGIVEAPVKYAH